MLKELLKLQMKVLEDTVNIERLLQKKKSVKSYNERSWGQLASSNFHRKTSLEFFLLYGRVN